MGTEVEETPTETSKLQEGICSGGTVSLRAKPRCVCEALEPPRAGGAAFGNSAHRRPARGNNFTKAARWSPDGSTVLAGHDDAALRLYNLPEVLREGCGEEIDAGTLPLRLEPYVEITEGGSILDFCFFPGYAWNSPATCCFLSTSQGHPIHLRDAIQGTLRNSYRPYNHVDEVCHAYSLCFSIDGGRIVAGFQQYLRIFDVQRPGRQTEDWLLSTKKGSGQKGIIGALAASYDSPGLYAAGSYNRSACVYHQGSKGKQLARFVDTEPDYEMGGVTQIEWAGEWLLLTGHRKDKWLRAWDVRMAGDVQYDQGASPDMRPRALLHRFARPTRTHQRYLFSVSGDIFATGEDNGTVLFYSLSSLQEIARISDAHARPCVSAMLHPSSSLLLTASGERCFPDYDVESPDGSRSHTPDPVPSLKRRRSDIGNLQCLDNAVRVWRLAWSGRDLGANV